LLSPEEAVVDLTSGEFDLLLAFVERPHRVLNRDQLLDLTRGRDATPFDRSIDVQVSRLRRKIENDPKVPELIKTVRSGGYLFTPAVERT
jgi:two-component system OmpR family response regulator